MLTCLAFRQCLDDFAGQLRNRGFLGQAAAVTLTASFKKLLTQTSIMAVGLLVLSQFLRSSFLIRGALSIGILFAILSASLTLYWASPRPFIKVADRFCANQTSAVILMRLYRPAAFGNCDSVPHGRNVQDIAEQLRGPFHNLTSTHIVHCGNIWAIRYSSSLSEFRVSFSYLSSSAEATLLRFIDTACASPGRPQNCSYQFFYSHNVNEHTPPVTVICP